MSSAREFIRGIDSRVSGLGNYNNKGELSPMKKAPTSAKSSGPKQDEFIGRALASVPSTDTHIADALPTLASMLGKSSRNFGTVA